MKISPTESVGDIFLILFANKGNITYTYGDHRGNNDLWNHIQTVVEDRINKRKSIAAEYAEYLFSNGVKSLLREEPFCPCTVKDIARNDMAQIAMRERNDNAENYSRYLVLYLVTEDASNSEDGVRKKIINNDYRKCSAESHIVI